MQHIDTSSSQLHEISQLELLAQQIVEGFIVGLHKSPFHGFSVEFAEHRLYNSGESTRNLDWKVFARTEKLFTKKYEEETNLRCQIIIDHSSSMYYPYDPQKVDVQHSKIGFSAVAAASIMQLLKKQRDAFGLGLFSDKLDVLTSCRSSTTHFRLMLSHLEQLLLASKKDHKTSAAKTLHEIAESIHRRSLVILFSDMFDGNETEELFSALQHLRHNKHEVILFHVTDKKHELDFDFENRPYQFIDLESGEEIKLQSGQVKQHYLEHMQAYMKELITRCHQYRIEFVEADINKGFNQILMPYLVKRKKML